MEASRGRIGPGLGEALAQKRPAFRRACSTRSGTEAWLRARGGVARCAGRGPHPKGTLYPLLNGFERDGLTSAEWADPKETGPARKTYALTHKGRDVLAEAAKRWAAFNESLGGFDGPMD